MAAGAAAAGAAKRRRAGSAAGGDGGDGDAYFSMGPGTIRVPMALHRRNRERLAAAMRGAGCGGVVLLRGGEQETQDCSDTELVFRQESYFQWATGAREPGCLVAVRVRDAAATLFVPRLPKEYAIWMGRIHPPQHFRDRYAVEDARYVDELPQWLAGEASGAALDVHTLYGQNSDSGKWSAPAEWDGMDDASKFRVRRDALFARIAELRVVKTPLELAVMREVNAVSSRAHVDVMRAARAGMAEYELESLFLHRCYANGGCRLAAYTCICACGPNSSVLHYGHAAAPNDRRVAAGDMALLDMGAEYHCYCSDITCSFPIGGRFSDDQRRVWNIELAAFRAVMDGIRPGADWAELHRCATRAILSGLKEWGVLRGDVDEMERADVGSVFFPCGMGHLLGLNTHDVGGYLPDCPPRRTEWLSLRKLRTARILEEGMVLTVEPGVYFIDEQLDEALGDERARFMVPERVEALRGTGGVRLEDNIAVTSDGFENYTLCPRTIDEVEAVMAGGQWPPVRDDAPWLHRKWGAPLKAKGPAACPRAAEATAGPIKGGGP